MRNRNGNDVLAGGGGRLSSFGRGGARCNAAREHGSTDVMEDRGSRAEIWR